MACDCLDKVDANLAAHNTRLKRSFVLEGPRAGVYPVFGVELIEKRRGQSPVSVIPTFCPFCAKKYGEG